MYQISNLIFISISIIWFWLCHNGAHQKTRMSPSLQLLPLLSSPQPQTKLLSWLATWTTLTTPSSLHPWPMFMNWPTCSGNWTSRWCPCWTSTGRRWTVQSQSSSCCLTRGSTVSLSAVRGKCIVGKTHRFYQQEKATFFYQSDKDDLTQCLKYWASNTFAATLFCSSGPVQWNST